MKSLPEQYKNHYEALADGLKRVPVNFKRSLKFLYFIAEGRCDLLIDLDVVVIMNSPLDFISRKWNWLEKFMLDWSRI